METSTLAGNAGPSRRVADMDLERLYRKRAIDRENQRNLRQKNKQRARELEQQVHDLEKRLEESQRNVARLTGKSMATHSTIDTIIASLQSLQRTVSLQEPFDSSNSGETPVHAIGGTQPAGNTDTTVTDDTSDLPLWLNGGIVSFAGDNFSYLPDFSFDLSYLIPPTIHSTPAGDANPSPPLPSQPSDEEFDARRKEANSLRIQAKLWSFTPRYSPPTCTADTWLVDLIESRKQYQGPGPDPSELSSRDFPSINSLINPSLTELDKPVASAIAKHLTGVVRVHTLPEKIALLYVISLLTRWQIAPSKESFEAIPDFARPTLAQIAIQHPCWVGTIGWPEARESIIKNMDFTEYPKFASIITRSFSINWPHGLNGIIQGHVDKGYSLNEAFITHIRNVGNWTVGQELVDSFPFLEGAVNIK